MKIITDWPYGAQYDASVKQPWSLKTHIPLPNGRTAYVWDLGHGAVWEVVFLSRHRQEHYRIEGEYTTADIIKYIRVMERLDKAA